MTLILARNHGDRAQPLNLIIIVSVSSDTCTIIIPYTTSTVLVPYHYHNSSIADFLKDAKAEEAWNGFSHSKTEFSMKLLQYIYT